MKFWMGVVTGATAAVVLPVGAVVIWLWRTPETDLLEEWWLRAQSTAQMDT